MRQLTNSQHTVTHAASLRVRLADARDRARCASMEAPGGLRGRGTCMAGLKASVTL